MPLPTNLAESGAADNGPRTQAPFCDCSSSEVTPYRHSSVTHGEGNVSMRAWTSVNADPSNGFQPVLDHRVSPEAVIHRATPIENLPRGHWGFLAWPTKSVTAIDEDFRCCLSHETILPGSRQYGSFELAATIDPNPCRQVWRRLFVTSCRGTLPTPSNGPRPASGSDPQAGSRTLNDVCAAVP